MKKKNKELKHYLRELFFPEIQDWENDERIVNWLCETKESRLTTLQWMFFHPRFFKWYYFLNVPMGCFTLYFFFVIITDFFLLNLFTFVVLFGYSVYDYLKKRKEWVYLEMFRPTFYEYLLK